MNDFSIVYSSMAVMPFPIEIKKSPLWAKFFAKALSPFKGDL